MKSPLVLALTSPLLLAAAFSPSAAHAAVVWMSDFETGQISEFGQSLNATKGTRQNIEFVMDPVQHGKLACKIVIHPDDNFQPYDQNRVEMHHVTLGRRIANDPSEARQSTS
jgi:Spy/CpxP family protein refolding chaperone